MKKKIQWTNEVLNSTNGIKRAKPSNNLFSKITDQISEIEKPKVIPLTKLRWIAASVIAVVCVNLYTLQQQSEKYNNNISESINDIYLLSNYNLESHKAFSRK